MAEIQHVSQLSPDGFSRFFFLADILRQAYEGTDTTVSILDVGGASEFLEQQLKACGIRYALTVLDVLPKPKGLESEYIQADATKMTLEDGSFDVVVSTDVIEHIPQDLKRNFITECVRVSKHFCVIAGPFDTTGVNEAEVVVNDFNKGLFGVGQGWLEEHFQYGKPSIQLFESLLNELHVEYGHFGTQNLIMWLLNTHINLIDAKLGLNTAAHKEINSFYGEHILRMNETVSPTYRHFFVAYKDPAFKERIDLRRYVASEIDYEAVSHYTGSLMGLFSSRIQELGEQNESIRSELGSSQAERVAAAAQIAELRKTVQEQAETLTRFNSK